MFYEYNIIFCLLFKSYIKSNALRWQYKGRGWGSKKANFILEHLLISAGLNVVISNIAACLNIATMLSPALRIIVGPLPTNLVVCAYYLIRINITFTITILTARIVLMIAFILDFNTMSGKNN